MKKLIYIGIIAVVMTACGVSQAPLDDAYYWPDKQQKQETIQEQEKIEYVNVQDTTVTIRVNR